MTHYKIKKVVLVLVTIGMCLYAVSWYVAREQSDMSAQVRLLIANQTTTLSTIAEMTDRDGADLVTELIVQDCAPLARERFDLLLGNLSKLTATELIEVDRLFASCGNFYTQRKAVMVARFRREYEVYASYIDLLSRVDGRARGIEYPVDSWEELVQMEETRSKFSSELVVIQGDIIASLKQGTPKSSETITLLLTKAQEAHDNLSYTSIQIDALRREILDV